MITAIRYHDISCGHRVYGHESKCAHLHGHNYRFTFEITADKLDDIGRVIDFSVIKSLLCMWLEENWDHKFLLWESDPLFHILKSSDPEGVVLLPMNPTAENLAQYFTDIIAPQRFKDTGVKLIKCTVEETRKCSATYSI